MTMTWQKEEIEVESGEKVSVQMPVVVSASRSTDIPAFYSDWFVEHNRCIDDRLIVRCFSHDAELMKFVGARFVPGDLFGVPDRWEPGDRGVGKGKGQREACGCIMSKDIGEYNTCPHLCHYCYANANNATALANWKRHKANPRSETITGGWVVRLRFSTTMVFPAQRSDL